MPGLISFGPEMSVRQKYGTREGSDEWGGWGILRFRLPEILLISGRQRTLMDETRGAWSYCSKADAAQSTGACP